jgi:hypothetical protein
MTFPLSLPPRQVILATGKKTLVGARWPAVIEAAASLKPGDDSLANRRAVGAAGGSACLARGAARKRRSRSARFSRT